MSEKIRRILSTGDVANLRSAGPAMTVAGFENEDRTPMDGPVGFNSLVRCIWFDGGGRLQAHTFPHGLLDGTASPGPASEEKQYGQTAAVQARQAKAEDKPARADKA